MLRAQGERAAAYLQAQGQAKAIEKTFAAIKAGRPTPEMLAYQYLQTLPEMARGDANKVWVVPSDFNAALQGFTRLLGKPGEDGVFRFEPSPVEDQPKHAARPVTTPRSPAGSPPDTRPVDRSGGWLQPEAIARQARSRVRWGRPPQVDSIEWSDEWFDLTENLCGTGSSAGGRRGGVRHPAAHLSPGYSTTWTFPVSVRPVLPVVKARLCGRFVVGHPDSPALARLTTADVDVVLHPRPWGHMSRCEIALLMRFRRRHS
ncbi:conserved hypothetical protein [Mycobacterium tuberculosis C]|nr:conserved hypothetical protein [Mycobacterium tuberculosis C]